MSYTRINYLPQEVLSLPTVDSATAGAIATFNTDLNLPLFKCVCSILASGGNGTPSTPIPIVGHTELNLTRCGKNLFDNSNFPSGYGSIVATYNADGTVKLNGTASGNEYFSVPINLPNNNYVMSVGNTSANANVHVSFVNHNNEFYGDNDLSTANKVVTISGDISAIVFYVLSGTTLTDFTIKPMLELSSTATAYEPYNGQTFTVAFGQTVYGGVYDKSGRLTITHASKTFIGSADENWSMLGSGSASAYCMAISISNKKYGTQVKADYLESITPNDTWGDYDAFISYGLGDSNIYTGIRTITTVADWKTYLSNNPLTVCYELATPIEIDVSALSVETIVGVNNVFCDTGDIEQLTYFESVGMKIQKGV